MNQIIELLKSSRYQIPKELIFNYKKLNMTELELILVIYLSNQESSIYNPKSISNDLSITLPEVLELVNSLSEKGILKVEVQKINNIRNEVINLDLLYEKIAFNLQTNDTKENDTNIYSIFENEFGRTLSPMEYEIINSWIDSGYSEELIILALKEATYNGVSNLRYIDKIIYEWGRKGIKNKDDVQKDKKQFKAKSNKQELFDYDWLNEESNN